MAKSILSFAISLLLLSILTLLSLQVNGKEPIVGGISKIPDVNSNQEVQDLGKYCVEQYNINRRKLDSNAESLIFASVVDGEQQVVAGIKYHLTIAVSDHGASKIFDAVVVVAPWQKNPKELLSFSPSPAN